MTKKYLLSLTMGAMALQMQAQHALSLHYNKPAEYFEESLVIGNGTQGAIIYGGTRQDKISLNDITLWTGEGQLSEADNPPTAAECASALKKTRELLDKEDYRNAEKAYRKVEGPHSEGYLPLGNVTITYLDKPNTKYENYQRSLNIAEALATTTYTINGYERKTEYIASAPDSVICIRISTTDPQGITALLSLDSQLPHSTNSGNMNGNEAANWISTTGYGPYHSEPGYYHGVDIHDLYDPERGVRFRTILCAVTEGGKAFSTESSEIKVNGCKSVTLYITNCTSYNGALNDPAKNGRDYKGIVTLRNQRVIGKSYDSIRSAQRSDHKTFFDRVALNLGTTPDSIAALPTDVQLQRYTDNGEKNPELEALYFQYGRYLLISCSRTEGVPANLQGLWNESLTPPWSGNYTTNINLEENYWPAEITNLSEMHQPLLKFVQNLAQSGRDTAWRYYGVKNGWCAGHNSDIWGTSAPVGRQVGDTMWATWNMGGAWLATHLWEHYMFTLDKDYLRNIYSTLKGAAEFCLDWMIEKNGELITSPSTSPENQYRLSDGFSGSTFYGSTADLEFIRECLIDTKEAAKVLNEDKDFIIRIDNALAKMRKYKVSKTSGLLEWYHDWDDNDPQHRHQSHLFNIFPGHNPMGMEAAAAKTLEIKGDKTTGWSTGWRINLFARLKDSNKAYKMFKTLLTYVSPQNYRGSDARHGGGTFPNLLDAHPPFQIDGNFGGTAGVAEMLIQSEYADGNSTITLLPALPEQWTEGNVSGLCARGGFVIDMQWKNGKVVSATISSRNGGTTTVNYNGKTKKISLKKGGKQKI